MNNSQTSPLKSLGYSFPHKILDRSVAANFKDKFIESDQQGQLNGHLKYQSFLHNPCLYDLCRHPAIKEVITAITGPESVIWNTAVFIKPAQSPLEMLPHQDCAYDGVLTDKKYTLYLALTENNPETGSLYFFEKSHLDGEHQHDFSKDPNNMHSNQECLKRDFSPYKKTDLYLSPGEASLHNMRLVHGSHPNQSSKPRVNIAIRFFSTDTEVRGTPQYAIHLGAARHPNLIEPPHPGNLSTAERQELYQRSLKAFVENYKLNRKLLLEAKNH